MDKEKDPISQIVSELEYLEVNVQNQYMADDGKYYFLCDYYVITYKIETRQLSISFHISLLPDTAAYIACSLDRLPCVEDIYIGDVFMIGDNDELLTGEKCISTYQTRIRNQNITDYMEDQRQFYILKNDQVGKEC